jgi:hypothetical protein
MSPSRITMDIPTNLHTDTLFLNVFPSDLEPNT